LPFSGCKTDRNVTNNAVTGGGAVAGVAAGVLVGAIGGLTGKVLHQGD